MDFRSDIVIVFAVLVAVILISVVLRSTYSTMTEWWEGTWEGVNRRKAAAQFLGKIENRPRQELVEIALAVALSQYNWPNRRTDDDEGLVRSRERHLAVFTSLSDEDLKKWIKEEVQGTHPVFLKVALESLDLAADAKDNRHPR